MVKQRLGAIVRLWLAAAVVACACATVAFAQTATPPAPVVEKIDGDYGPHKPPDISTHGKELDQIIDVVHIFMALLFVGWGIFFVYCLGKFRQKTGHKAVYDHIKAKPSKYVEYAVIGIEAALLLFLSIPAWGKVKNNIPTDRNPLEVRVVAEQFAWNFHYAGPDGKFGKTGPQFVEAATNPVGLDREHDPDAKDDVVSGEFHLVVHRPVITQISSKDVIHSFGIPVLRVKQDAIPGMRIPVWFEATRTGRYQVACAQLCGNNHYKMLAPMVIESDEAFSKWLAEKAKPPEEFIEE